MTKKIIRRGLVFGKPAVFEEIYPEIENIKIKIKETESGYFTYFDKKESVPPFIKCHNPLCRGGIFSIRKVLDEMVSKRETYKKGGSFCHGRERAGRKDFRLCLNRFEYEITIKYKNINETKD